MTCNKCGTVCADGAKFCNVCGAALEAPAAPQQPQPTPAPEYANATPATPAVAEDPGKGMALASLICGIVAVVCNCCGIANILAIIFGLVAKSKGSKDTKATIGIILGAVSIVLGIIAWIVYFVVYAGSMATLMDSGYYY